MYNVKLHCDRAATISMRKRRRPLTELHHVAAMLRRHGTARCETVRPSRRGGLLLVVVAGGRGEMMVVSAAVMLVGPPVLYYYYYPSYYYGNLLLPY